MFFPSETRQTGPGLVELLGDASTRIARGADPREVDYREYRFATPVPNLDLIAAGCDDSGYAKRVAALNWQALFEAAPEFFPELADTWATDYDYVLIDARTGLSDMGGISTMLLPEALVLVFVPNRQSLLGLLAVTKTVLGYRRNSHDLRPLVAYPLPSRLDACEHALRTQWRREPDYGYQPRFEQCFRELYGEASCNLENYFDEVQIPYVPRYAFGENIAALVDSPSDPLSLAGAFQRFVPWLRDSRQPWEEF
jgi:eukaryotic-like serine/threonine-protein kinase